MLIKKINILQLRLFALIAFGLILSLKAYSFEYNGIHYNILSAADKTVTVASNTSASGEVVIPAYVECDGYNYKVVSISTEAFKEASITSITMPEGLESIGGDAFLSCKNLTKVKVPNTVTSVGNGSFALCSKLESISYGKNVNKIGKDIFTGLSSLKYVYSLNPTPPAVDTWGTTTTSATLYVPANSIESYRKATVWKNFQRILDLSGNSDDPYYDPDDEPVIMGKCPFENLKKLEIGNQVETISRSFFKNGINLTDIAFGNGLKEIGEDAFSGCSSLTEVVLPPTLETIGASAFAGNGKLDKIIMGHSVKSIGEKAFDGAKASTVSITAQTPPTAPNNTFSVYSGKLYVQGEKAKDAYYDAFTCWDRFDSYVMIDAEEIKLEGADKISGKAGDTFQLTATIWPENVTLPQIFWRSTNPEIATVDQNGLVTLHVDLDQVLTRAQGDADIDGTCTIIAETLYNDGPVAQMTVDGEINAVETIFGSSHDNGIIDYNEPYEVYNLNGMKVADSKDDLSKGLYIIRQGKAAAKISIR